MYCFPTTASGLSISCVPCIFRYLHVCTSLVPGPCRRCGLGTPTPMPPISLGYLDPRKIGRRVWGIARHTVHFAPAYRPDPLSDFPRVCVPETMHPCLHTPTHVTHTHTPYPIPTPTHPHTHTLLRGRLVQVQAKRSQLRWRRTHRFHKHFI